MSWTRLGALINFMVSIACIYLILTVGDSVPSVFGYPVGIMLARSVETLIFKQPIPSPSA